MTTSMPKTVVVTNRQQQQLPKNYAGFNTLTVEGRIFHAEIINGSNGEFLTISVIQNLMDDDEGCEFTFNNSNGLLGLYKQGYLPTGRRVHLTGHMKSVEASYTDRQTGEIRLLQRPRVKMDRCDLQLGAMPSKKDA